MADRYASQDSEAAQALCHALRGAQAYDRFDREGYDQAAAPYQQALDLDKTFAPAAIGLTQVLVSRAQWGYVAPNIGYELARQAAENASQLDPQASAAHQGSLGST